MNLVEIKHPTLEQTAHVPEEALGHWARAGWEPVEVPAVESQTEVPASAGEPESAQPGEADTEPAAGGEPADEPQPRRRRRTP